MSETTTEQLAEIEEQAEPVQVREGRWRQRNGDIRNVTPTPSHDIRKERWPWRDAEVNRTWSEGGLNNIIGKSPLDLVEYLGPIETQPKPQPEPQSQSQPVSDADQQIKLLEQANHNLAGTIGRLQARSNELEKLVTDLRTINEAQEKSVRLAGQENTDLKHRLNVVSAEWAEQVETSRRLQIELDAAQQVPQAVSDRFEEGWDAGTSQAVETVLEWLEPIRATIEAADNVQQTMRADNLACDIIRNLPAIMRSLTGLTQED